MMFYCFQKDQFKDKDKDISWNQEINKLKAIIYFYSFDDIRGSQGNFNKGMGCLETMTVFPSVPINY
jgi:hypothetical protein